VVRYVWDKVRFAAVPVLSLPQLLAAAVPAILTVESLSVAARARTDHHMQAMAAPLHILACMLQAMDGMGSRAAVQELESSAEPKPSERGVVKGKPLCLPFFHSGFGSSPVCPCLPFFLTPSVSFYLSLDSAILHYPATNKKERREYKLRNGVPAFSSLPYVSHPLYYIYK
jgi:hypothetical protein